MSTEFIYNPQLNATDVRTYLRLETQSVPYISDSSGNAYAYENENWNITYEAAKFNNGGVFSNSSTVDITYRNWIGVDTGTAAGAVSFFCWYKTSAQPTTTASTWHNISRVVNLNQRGLCFRYVNNGGTKQLEMICQGNVDNTVDINQTFTDGTWYHIGYTVDKQAYTCYVNGSSIGTGTFTNTNTTLAQGTPQTIGCYHAAWQGVAGTLDDVIVFAKVLTGTNITDIYSNNYYPPVPPAYTDVQSKNQSFWIM